MSAPRPDTGETPLWREEFSVRAADERYVGRRQFAKFLVLTSVGMFAGQVWVLARRLFRRPALAVPDVPVARVGEIPPGGVKLFRYPGPNDACLLIRRGEEYAAFSQKCTHLSCAVYYSKDHDRIECPCHEGYFSAADGRVLQGPPERPLPRIRLERRGDELVATGVASEPEA